MCLNDASLSNAQVPNRDPVMWAKRGQHRFYYQQSYSTRFRQVKGLSYEAANYRPPEQSLAESELPEMKGNPLATLDIFSGCGGLSYGLEMSGVAKIKWGIELEDPPATAFQKNHPDAIVLSTSVNYVLKDLLNGEEVICRILRTYFSLSFVIKIMKSYHNCTYGT